MALHKMKYNLKQKSIQDILRFRISENTEEIFKLSYDDKVLCKIIEANVIDIDKIQVCTDWIHLTLSYLLIPFSDKRESKLASKLWSVVTENLTSQLSYMFHGLSMNMSNRLGQTAWLQSLGNTSKYEDILLSNFVLLDTLVKQTQNTYQGRIGTLEERIVEQVKESVFKLGDDSLFLSTRSMIVKSSEGLYLLPRTVLLLIHNKCSEWLSSFVMVRITDGIVHRRGFFEERFLPWMRECARILRVNKDAAFKLFKLFDGILTSMIIKDEEDWPNLDFYHANILGVDESEGLSYQWKDSTLECLANQMSPDEKVDIIGTCKLFGYPNIDYEKGLTKLYEVTHKHIDTDPQEIASVINYTKMKLCEAFFTKHGRWPNVLLSPDVCPRLQYCVLKQFWITDSRIPFKLNHVRTLDWTYLTLGKNAEYDFMETQIDLLKDKAIVPTRTDYFKALAGTKKIPLSDRRALLHFIMTDNISKECEGEMRKLMHGSMLDKDYLLIKLTAKEKELKSEGRFFGQTTFMNRQRLITQNFNAKKLFGRYLRVSTLTYSELDTTQRIFSLHHLQMTNPDSQIFIYTLDAEKWNSHFRDDLVSAFGRLIVDKWFGVHIYCNTQRYYQDSLFVCPTGVDTWSWEGQEGGVEGLNQDEWAAMWSCGICSLLDRHGINHHAMTKGDDVRLILVVPRSEIEKLPEKESTFIAEIKELIGDYVTKLGHVQKYNETYVSCVFFSWSKSHWLRSIKLPSMIKKCCKVDGYSNMILPTLKEKISASMAAAHSTCVECDVHLAPYALGLYRALLHLSSTKLFNLGVEKLVALTLWPSPLGGLPIPPLVTFFQRSESDLLAWGVSILFFLIKTNTRLSTSLSFLCNIELSKKISKEQILSDPYSLPISKPMGADSVIHRYMRTALVETCKNKDLKEILRVGTGKERSRICDTLWEITPFHAKMASALYDCCPAKVVDDLISKFESARSIFQFLTVFKGARRAMIMLNRAMASEGKEIDYWFFVLSTPHGTSFLQTASLEMIKLGTSVGHVSICPTQFCLDVRERGWGKPIIGITYPPLTEQLRVMTSDEGVLLSLDMKMDISRNHFACTIFDPTQYASTMSPRRYCSGDKRPFLGVQTSSGLSETFVKIDTSSPALKSVDKLLKIYAFTRRYKSNLSNLIINMLKQFTRLKVDTLDPFIPTQVHGTSTHRLRAHGFREQIAPNSPWNKFSRTVVDTDTYHDLRMDDADYTINYMGILCYLVEMSFLSQEFSDKEALSNRVWAILNGCKTCYSEVPKETYSLTGNSLGAALVLGNPLLQLSLSEEITLQNEILTMVNTVLRAPTGQVSTTVSRVKAKEIVSSMFCDEMIYKGLLSNIFRTGAPSGTSRMITQVLFHLPDVKWSISTIRRLDMMDIIQSCVRYLITWAPCTMGTTDIQIIQSWVSSIDISHLPFQDLLISLSQAGMLSQFFSAIFHCTGERCPLEVETNFVKAARWVVKCLITLVPATLDGFIDDMFPICYIQTGSDITRKREDVLRTWTKYFMHIINYMMCHNESDAFSWGEEMDFKRAICLVLAHVIPSCNPDIQFDADTFSVPFLLDVDEFLDMAMDNPLLYQDLHPVMRSYLKMKSHEELVQLLLNNHEVSGLSLTEAVHDINNFINDHDLILDVQLVSKELYIEFIRDDLDMSSFEEASLDDFRISFQNILSVSPVGRFADCTADCQTYLPNFFQVTQYIFPNPPMIPHDSQDHNYADVVRPFGSTVTSLSKILEIIDMFNIKFPEHSLFVCTGEGQGGILATLLTLYPKSIGILNDLMSGNETVSSYFPVEIMNMQCLDRCRYKYLVTTPTDITDTETHKSIQMELARCGDRQAHLLTCDAESSKDSSPGTMLEAMYRLCTRVLRPGGWCICKSYARPDTFFYQTLAKMSNCFSRVYIVRLTSTRECSSEIYIVCQDYAGYACYLEFYTDEKLPARIWFDTVYNFLHQVSESRETRPSMHAIDNYLTTIPYLLHGRAIPFYFTRWMNDQCGFLCAQEAASLDSEDFLEFLHLELSRMVSLDEMVFVGLLEARVRTSTSLNQRIRSSRKLCVEKCILSVLGLISQCSTMLRGEYLDAIADRLCFMYKQVMVSHWNALTEADFDTHWEENSAWNLGGYTIHLRKEARKIITACFRLIGMLRAKNHLAPET